MGSICYVLLLNTQKVMVIEIAVSLPILHFLKKKKKTLPRLWTKLNLWIAFFNSDASLKAFHNSDDAASTEDGIWGEHKMEFIIMTHMIVDTWKFERKECEWLVL